MALLFWMFMALWIKGLFYGIVGESKHYTHDR